MKRILTLVLSLGLGVAPATAVWASPLLTDFDRSLFYACGDSFGGGGIAGGTIQHHNGFGMGFIVPLSSQSNVGLKFSSPDYDDIYGELQWSWLRNPDVLRFTYDQYGHDGSIIHFGLYRDFCADPSWAWAVGTGLAVFHVRQADQAAYLSLFAEAQARYLLGKDSFCYGGVRYDYHLRAAGYEAGLGINL